MKNTSYFILKGLFVLKIFKFLPCLFGHVAKRLDEKDMLISNFMIFCNGLIRKRKRNSKFMTSKPG